MRNNPRKNYINDLKHHLIYIGVAEKKSLDILNREIE